VAGNYARGYVLVPNTTTLFMSATSGYGSLLFPIPAGDAIYGIDSIDILVQEDGVTFGLAEAIEAGEDVIVRARADDSAAQTALAAIEGGDGIHEYSVANRDWNATQAQAAADAELGFSEVLRHGTWQTGIGTRCRARIKSSRTWPASPTRSGSAPST
jgi:hypothetical protein